MKSRSLPSRLKVLLLAPLMVLLAGPLAGAASATSQEEFRDKFLMLGTGPEGGAFRPIGESVCNAVNTDRKATLVRCVPVGTAGSTFNLHSVANGALQLGVAQEDLAAQFYTSGKQEHAKSLRVIAVLHSSPIAVMVHRSAGITELRQIAGKRINLGNRGSGQFAITAAILRALDLNHEDFASVSHLPTSEFEKAFCERRVDVVVEAVAHPSSLFEKLRACDGEFIDIPPDVIARMKTDNPRLSPMAIPAATYEGQAGPVTTLGMRNVLLTSATVDEEAVFRLASTLNQRYADLRANQPLLRSMASPLLTELSSLPAPLHPGAERALRQGASGVAR